MYEEYTVGDLLGWNLVERKILVDNSTSVTFNVNSDARAFYFIYWFRYDNAGASNPYLFITPNGNITANQSSSTHWHGWWGGNNLHTNETGRGRLEFVRPHGGGLVDVHGTCLMFNPPPEIGIRRTTFSEHLMSTGNDFLHNTTVGIWTDGTTLLTSIKLDCSQGSGSQTHFYDGFIECYQKAPVWDY